jgi:hypothetical protein
MGKSSSVFSCVVLCSVSCKMGKSSSVLSCVVQCSVSCTLSSCVYCVSSLRNVQQYIISIPTDPSMRIFFLRVWHDMMFWRDEKRWEEKVLTSWNAALRLTSHCSSTANANANATPAVLCCAVLCCAMLYCTVLYQLCHPSWLAWRCVTCCLYHCSYLLCWSVCVPCVTWPCRVMHCTAWYCTVLYCTVQYCIVLYCTALHCTVL